MMLDRCTRTPKYGLHAFVAGVPMAVLLLVGGCSRQSGSAGAVQEVRREALAIVAAYNAREPHAAAAYDAPDYVGVYHGSPNTIGPAADEAGMKMQMEAASVDWKLGADKVTVAKAGDLAVFEAPYAFVIGMPGGSQTTEQGTWIAIFKRQKDGAMKLWRSIASDTPAPKRG